MAGWAKPVDTQKVRFGTTVPALVACVVLAAPAAASADFLHVVTRGESLRSVAATDGLSVSQIAAANGISPTTELRVGSTLAIPPRTRTVAAVAAPSGASGAALYGKGDGERDVLGSVARSTAPTSLNPTAGVAAPGSYVVRSGDTLWAIAARAGMTVAQLAADNGLNPRAYLISGTVLRVGAGPAVTGVSSTAGETVTVTKHGGLVAEASSTAPPYPTPERVTAGEIASIAAANGVPASLADAIGWQESGFNNDLVSSAGARGVMQILPATWEWINASLAPTPLSPYSAADNVRGGVLLLHSLLNATGGSPSMAAAGYYQGLPSVERYGLFRDTQRYVDDVLSLTSSFGGR